MKLTDLTNQSGEWLLGTGPQHEIVVSSRVRLARNVASYPFMSKANRLQRTELHKMCREQLLGLSGTGTHDDFVLRTAAGKPFAGLVGQIGELDQCLKLV